MDPSTEICMAEITLRMHDLPSLPRCFLEVTPGVVQLRPKSLQPHILESVAFGAELTHLGWERNSVPRPTTHVRHTDIVQRAQTGASRPPDGLAAEAMRRCTGTTEFSPRLPLGFARRGEDA